MLRLRNVPCACDDPTVAGVPGVARMEVATAWKVASVVPEMVRRVWELGKLVGEGHGEQTGVIQRWGMAQVSGAGGAVMPWVKLCPLRSGLTCGRPGASWAFLSCPPEDECANGHHDCNETQNCHDQPHGYECSCKTGYTMDK